MAKIQKNFIKGRMNKSVDERLVPQGEYIDALNVRLGSTEGTEIGAVENSKGNELIVELIYDGNPLSSNAKCIGAYEDGVNETIYWFVNDEQNISSPTGNVDLIVSYNTRTSILFYHVDSPNTLFLRFAKLLHFQKYNVLQLLNNMNQNFVWNESRLQILLDQNF